jgi:hypothetical protein
MLKTVLLIWIMAMVLCTTSGAETRADLSYMFRARIGETDATTSFVSDTVISVFLNQGQDKIVSIGGFLPNYTTITYSTDSTKYSLPAGVKVVNGVTVLDEGVEHPVLPNPYFMVDTSAFSFYITWNTPDTAELRLKSPNFYEGQVVTVHYNGDAADLITASTVCEVPSNLHVFIVEEAISYYEEAKRNFAGFQLLNAIVRRDLGVGREAPNDKR